MKKVILPFALYALLFNFTPAFADSSDPDVVPAVDFNRYSGLWYDIAHAPNFFQKDCVRSTAEYQVLTPLSVSVKNICYKANGSSSDIEGEAKVVDPTVPAKLKVRFNIFARGDYWIIDLDPNYQWAVVSAPKKKSLFILSRQAPMDSVLLEKIVQSLKAKGFATEDLVYGQY
ncbi:lipocalin family protein [Bdellovibrio sp. HCB2-146]|uniref:lipocalin family protein n=1 Tax=Bdellovibrio sp. HCB2-146 TaxID=3394362 RepID=UPI0039BD1EB2